MPWLSSSTVSQRERFALRALQASISFAELCRDFQISRKTGYKWLRRFREGGQVGLHDQARGSHQKTSKLQILWQNKVARLRARRPHWGAKKLRQCLRDEHPRVRLPAVRTIGRWLLGLRLTRTSPRRARRGPAVPHPGLTKPRQVQQVWTLDFKGWIRTTDGQCQHPLTLREAKSRYLLDIRLLPNQSDQSVRRAMTQVFRREGLPTAIRVDNGAPFAGNGALGLSRLSVWWLRLGIRPEFTRRARPGDNAAHEQMHSAYKAEVLHTPAPHRHGLQKRSDRWRQDYNCLRPHEALGQRKPIELYHTSSRSLPPALSAIDYPVGLPVRRVRSRGHIKWQGLLRFIGRAFVGEKISLHLRETSLYEVRLGHLLIGHLHLQDAAGMRPAYWSRLPSSPLKL